MGLCWGSKYMYKRDGLEINLSCDLGCRLVHGDKMRMVKYCPNIHGHMNK
jgi:hypothetical protein